jgi:copper chaperone CopZ
MDKTENTHIAGPLETRDLVIAGMGCDNCARKLDRALRATDGVKEVRVDSIAGRATVTYDRSRTSIPALQEVVVKSGYRAGAVELSSTHPHG